MDDLELNEDEYNDLTNEINYIRKTFKIKTESDNKIKIESDKKKIQKEFNELLNKNSKIIFTISLALITLLIIAVMAVGIIKENTRKPKYANSNTSEELNFSEDDFVPGNELKVIQAYQYSINTQDYQLYKAVVGNFGVIDKFSSQQSTYYQLSSSISKIEKLDDLQITVWDNHNQVHNLINVHNHLYYREDLKIR